MLVRLARSLLSQKVSVIWAGRLDERLVPMQAFEKISWAAATRSIRRCRVRIEQIGGSHIDTAPTVWGLDTQIWNLLWTGEKVLWRCAAILKKAGYESVEDLSRTAASFRSSAYQELAPVLRLTETSSSAQRIRVRVTNQE